MSDTTDTIVRITQATDQDLLDSVIGTLSDEYQNGDDDAADEKYIRFRQGMRSQLLSSDVEESTLYRKGVNRSSDFVIRNGELQEYRGRSTKVTIPDNVTVIGERAFYRNRFLIEVSMSASVKMISDSAFAGCQSLRTVKFSDEILFMGRRAFSDCTALTSAALPKNLVYAGKLAFAGCQSLLSVKINQTLKIIEEGMLMSCAGLRSIEIPEGVTYIAPCAFAFCSELEKAELSDTVERIGACSFFGCQLTQITIPSSVNVIGEFAFGCFAKGTAYYCDTGFVLISRNNEAAKQYASEHQLGYSNADFVIVNGVLKQYTGAAQNVVIPGGVSVIGEGAFDGNTSVRRVVIPDSVTRIESIAFRESGLTEFWIGRNVQSLGDAVFSFCSNLKTVDLNSNALHTIGAYVFDGCGRIEELHLPRNLTQIESGSFTVANGLLPHVALRKIEVDAKNPALRSINGVLYSKDLKTLIFYPQGRTQTEFIVPSHVETIGEGAFTYAINLRSVTIPGSTKVIGKEAFSDCDSLSRLQIKNGVREIGTMAFCYCSSIRSVQIPGSVKKIPPCAFSECSELKSVVLDEGIKEIEENAFEDCKKLKSVLVPSSVTRIGESAFGTFLGEDGEEYPVPDFMLYGSSGSIAEKYAEDCGVNFFAVW